MYEKFVQNEYSASSEWIKVSKIADEFYNYVTMNDVAAKIAEANKPGVASHKIQDILTKKANELGFKDESKGLFREYANRHLRPDYFLPIDNNTGILIEVERGKTNINNMDFLDFWKCHICKRAHYLFLFVPVELHQNQKGKPSKPYNTVVSHIQSFFEPENYTNVRGVVVFGY